MEIIQLNSTITRAKILLDGLNSREMTEDGTSGCEDKRTEFTQSEQQAENRPKMKCLRAPWDNRRATCASLGSQEERASRTERKHLRKQWPKFLN